MHETARLHQSGVYGNHHTQSRYPSLYTPYAASSRVRIPTRALSHSGHGTSSSFASSVRPAHMPFTSGPGIWERYPPQLTAQYRPYAPSNLVLIVADGSRPDVVAQVHDAVSRLAGARHPPATAVYDPSASNNAAYTAAGRGERLQFSVASTPSRQLVAHAEGAVAQFCWGCGAGLVFRANFCARCGERVAQADEMRFACGPGLKLPSARKLQMKESGEVRADEAQVCNDPRAADLKDGAPAHRFLQHDSAPVQPLPQLHQQQLQEANVVQSPADHEASALSVAPAKAEVEAEATVEVEEHEAAVSQIQQGRGLKDYGVETAVAPAEDAMLGDDQAVAGAATADEDAADAAVDEDGFTVEEARSGEQLLASKPWVGVLKAFRAVGFDGCAAAAKGAAAPAAGVALSLELAHGCSAAAGVHHAASGAAVYATAAVTCLLDPGGVQRRLLGHSAEISCVTVDPTGRWVATGEARSKSLVFVWDTEDGTQLAALHVKGRHDKGISAICFSHDGSRLVTVGADDDNKIYVWDWTAGRDAKPVASEKGGRYRIVALASNPYNAANGPEGTFVTAGHQHIRFWHVQKGKLVKAGGSTDSCASVAFVKSTAADAGCTREAGAGYAVTALRDGTLAVWSADGRKKLAVVERGSATHKSATAVFATPAWLASGDLEGNLRVWDSHALGAKGAAPRLSLNLSTLLAAAARSLASPPKVAVRGLSLREEEGALRVLVAADHGALVLLSVPASEVAAPAEGAPAEAPATGVVATSAVQVTVLAQGHASLAAIAPGTAAPRTSGELWGLSAHSSAEAWASAGDDGAVQLWLAGHVAPAAGAYLAGGAGSRAVAFGPEVGDGGQRSAVLAVALRDGSVRLLDAALAPQPRLVPRGDGAGTVHTGRRECTVLRFSPCGCWLAVGSRDKTIDLFDARAAPPAKVAECIGHSSAVHHLDWSEDAEWLQSCSSDYELLFWKVPWLPEAPQDPASSVDARTVRPHTKLGDLSSIQWATMSSPVGWSTIGVLGSDGTLVKCVDRDAARSLLLAGTARNEVAAFAYPATEGAVGTASRGHASHVTNVRILPGGRRAVSAGGADNCLLEWAITSS